MGISPTTSGVDGSVQIFAHSSLTGDIPESTAKYVWKFSETVANPSYYNQKQYCSGWVCSINPLLIIKVIARFYYLRFTGLLLAIPQQFYH